MTLLEGKGEYGDLKGTLVNEETGMEAQTYKVMAHIQGKRDTNAK